MAVVSYYPGNTPVYMGLTADTKPLNVPAGSKFIETDGTNRIWLFLNSGSWLQIGVIAATPDLGMTAII
jgi:hypothetical protein